MSTDQQSSFRLSLLIRPAVLQLLDRVQGHRNLGCLSSVAGVVKKIHRSYFSYQGRICNKGIPWKGKDKMLSPKQAAVPNTDVQKKNFVIRIKLFLLT